MNKKLFAYIAASPTPFHAVSHTAEMLEQQGYRQLPEQEEWQLSAGGKYYTVRGGSSLIAFRLPKQGSAPFMLTAAHCDAPAFKIKENPELAGEQYVRLSTEGYGGMLCSTWMDRPLSVAGRVVLRTPNGMTVRNVDLKKPCALIPNLAIHMNRKANEGVAYNAAVDMLPVYSMDGGQGRLLAQAAADAEVCEDALITTELYLYNPQPGVEWGEYISAPRLDDLQCAFAALTAFLQAPEAENTPVYCLFNNEEVGSQTKQGAASTLLADTLNRISMAQGIGAEQHLCRIASSFLVSCDNAHAVHPNHPEYSDKNHAVRMNGGVVIKYNANQKYTTDSVSSAVFRLICEKTGTPCQSYANRADMPGGSTLGNIANTQVSLNSIDIGLAQLAMHSAFEMAGAEDTAHMVNALTGFYASELRILSDGNWKIQTKI